MGGADVGGLDEIAPACFAASMLACAADLADIPAFAGVNVAAAEDGIFGAMCQAYGAILLELKGITHQAQVQGV